VRVEKCSGWERLRYKTGNGLGRGDKKSCIIEGISLKN
jgi:hypothetical protein